MAKIKIPSADQPDDLKWLIKKVTDMLRERIKKAGGKADAAIIKAMDKEILDLADKIKQGKVKVSITGGVGKKAAAALELSELKKVSGAKMLGDDFVGIKSEATELMKKYNRRVTSAGKAVGAEAAAATATAEAEAAAAAAAKETGRKGGFQKMREGARQMLTGKGGTEAAPAGSVLEDLFSGKHKIGYEKKATIQAVIKKTLKDAGVKPAAAAAEAERLMGMLGPGGLARTPEQLQAIAREYRPGLISKTGTGLKEGIKGLFKPKPEIAAARGARYGTGLKGALKAGMHGKGAVGGIGGFLLLEALFRGKDIKRGLGFDEEFQARKAVTDAGPPSVSEMLLKLENQEALARRQAQMRAQEPEAFDLLSNAAVGNQSNPGLTPNEMFIGGGPQQRTPAMNPELLQQLLTQGTG